MGVHFGVIAIKTDKVEEVLKIADDYYHRFGLSLAEVSVVGINSDSEYTKEKFKDIKEFQEEYRAKKSNVAISTDFDVYFNLSENKNWVIHQYDRKAAKVTLNIDSELSKVLSKSLQTEVIEYYRYDVVNIFEIRKFVQGEVEFPYLEQNELNFESEELEMYTLGQWRRFYLEGSEENTKKYLSQFNVTFEGIKSAYNLMVNSLRSMQEYEKNKN